jgi:hypothetical protein
MTSEGWKAGWVNAEPTAQVGEARSPVALLLRCPPWPKTIAAVRGDGASR